MGDIMGSITDIVVDGLKYPFNDVNKYLGFGVIQVIMAFLFMGGFASLGSYVYNAFNASVLMELGYLDLSLVSPTMVVVAAILFVLGLVVFVFISGYEFNVLKYSISKNNELPAFNDYVEILKDGLKLIAVQIAYAILPAILFLLGLMLAVNANVGAGVNALGSFILAIAIIFAVIVEFFQVMAIARMADKGTLHSAFDFREIFDLISSMGIARYVGILIFLAIAIVIISMAASLIIEFIGFVVALAVPVALASVFLVMILEKLLLDSFTGIAIYRVFGSVYNVATGVYDFDGASESKDAQESVKVEVLDSEIKDFEEEESEVNDSEEEESEVNDSEEEESEVNDSEEDSSEVEESEVADSKEDEK